MKDITEQILDQDKRIADEHRLILSLCLMSLSEYNVQPFFMEDNGVLSFRILNRKDKSNVFCLFEYKCMDGEIVDGKINVSTENILDELMYSKNRMILSGLTRAINNENI